MKSNSDIRKATKDDIIHIFRLEEDAFSPMHYPLFVLRQLYDVFPDLFLVAVDNSNEIKGYCIGGIDHDNRTGWVFALAVTKPEQKKKIGERITMELLQEFKLKNIDIIKLTTTPDNSPAIRLYEKLGFKKISEDSDYYFDNSPRIIMRLGME